MSLFEVPELDDEERTVLALIDRLRDDLRDRVAEPRRWNGSLRRMALSRAVQGSNSIEGYNASLDDVAAVVEGEETVSVDKETESALAGYRDAMTYVLQVADDPAFSVDEGILKSLHFMMLRDRLDKNPGRWRLGPIYVQDEDAGQQVYEGPSAELVPDLIDELVDALIKKESDDSVLVRAAMAHLNLVMIHPFSDGNGRMARCLQTLILAREQIIAPVFSSIEEFLGRNARAYYDVLATVGGGAWNPANDARPWVRFCMRAHYIQIQTTIRRRVEAEMLWLRCVDLVDSKGLAERSVAALVEVAYGLRLRRGHYIKAVLESAGEELAEITASRDLKSLVDADLLEPVGQRRARHYVAGPRVQKVRDRVRADRPARADLDPFAFVRGRMQLPLSDQET